MKLLNREPTKEMLASIVGKNWREAAVRYWKVMYDPELDIVRDLYSTEQVSAIQSSLVKRDKTILEQQARIFGLSSGLDKLARLGNEPNYGNSFGNALAMATLGTTNISALEAALKAERIKTLEHLADKVCTSQMRQGKRYITPREIRAANELKEQSC